jgi:ADP-heptose:LPS heptosyltransferase
MPRQNKTLLLVYPDFLGDFLLFAPCLVAYKPWFIQQFDRVIWLCHPAVMPLVDSYRHLLPANMEVVPVNFAQTGLSLKKLLKWPVAMAQAKAFMRQHGLPLQVAQVWSPSLMPWLANAVVAAVKAPRKIGRPVQHGLYCRLQKAMHTELFALNDINQFVLFQHQQFFAQGFGQPLPVPDITFLAPENLPPVPDWCQDPYVVLVPDSAAESKEWPPEKFADLANHIIASTPYNVVVLGVRETAKQRFKARAFMTSRIQLRIGATTPLQVLPIVQQAWAMVCNDSFALHAATVMETPVICLTNGGYKGRYWPYPSSIPHTTQTYIEVTATEPTLTDIGLERVWAALAPYLPVYCQQPSEAGPIPLSQTTPQQNLGEALVYTHSFN